MKKKNIFWGLLFILAAVLIIINQFGFFPEVSMFDAVATVILVGIIISSIIHLNFWGILFPLACIGILFAEELNIAEFTPWPALLTALLCSIGLSLIFKTPTYWGFHSHKDYEWKGNVVNEQDGNVINCSASFGETMKYINSENFERANISCSFGEAKIYFDNVQIPSGKAEIYIDVSFGDATLFIPKTWKIINHVHVFFGDMSNVNSNLNAETPIITIHGDIKFGDCKIIYV